MNDEQKKAILFVNNWFREDMDEMLARWKEKCKSGNFEHGADKIIEAHIKNFDKLVAQITEEIIQKNEN